MRERSLRFIKHVNDALPPEDQRSVEQIRQDASDERDNALDAIDHALQMHLSLGDYRAVEHLARIARDLDAGAPLPPAAPTDWPALIAKLGVLLLKFVPSSSYTDFAKLAGGYEAFTGAALSQISPENISALVLLSDDEMESKIREVIPNIPPEGMEELIQVVRSAAEPSLPGNSVPTGRE